jgi:hypothetical protein
MTPRTKTPRTRTPRTRSKASARQIALRDAVERRRYQCDLLQFWRHCRDTPCRRKQACIGDPSACFDRGFASMSGEDKEWLRGAIMATVKGASTKGELIRRIDQEITAARRAKPMNCQELAAQIISILGAAGQETGPAAVPPVAPAQEREAVRRSRRPHELRAPVAAPDRELAITPDAVEPQEVEWTPATGSSRDAVRAAALPSSPGQADEGAAEPSPQPAWRWTGPLNPPQATCDEQGRLIMPDRTEYNERIRKGMSWVEIGKRERG